MALNETNDADQAQVWIRGPRLRQRWGGMSNTAFYDKLNRGLMPKPRYPFGGTTPYWLIAEIEEFESKAKVAA